jgi:hypothetical protein
VIEICVFCGDTNVRFLAIPVASFILFAVPLGLYCSIFQLGITRVTIWWLVPLRYLFLSSV